MAGENQLDRAYDDAFEGVTTSSTQADRKSRILCRFRQPVEIQVKSRQGPDQVLSPIFQNGMKRSRVRDVLFLKVMREFFYGDIKAFV